MERSMATIYCHILFHVLKNHKQHLTPLRAWAIGKILDVSGSGIVSINDIARAAGMKKGYLTRLLTKKSEFFIKINDNAIILKSHQKITKQHSLSKKKRRWEKITKKFLSQFKTKSSFIGFILKCYVEGDADPKFDREITRGRISYQMIADNFYLSKRTVIRNLISSGAIAHKNIIEIHSVKFKSPKDLGPWLLANMDKVIDGVRVGERASSFLVKKHKDGYCLTHQRPNRYEITCIVKRSLIDK